MRRLSTPPRTARDVDGSSDDDDDDAARFVAYVREHVHHAAAMNRRARDGALETGDDDGPHTPKRLSSVDRALASARASAVKAREARDVREARGRWEASEARATASARRLASSTGRRRSMSTTDLVEEDDVRTPVRVGTLRSTHMMLDGGEARALRFEAAAGETEGGGGRRASMTPPRALRMTVMSPGGRSEAVARLSESVRESSSSWAVATTTTTRRADEDARRDAEAELERLRARVVTMERDAEAAAVEKQMWLNERVRLGASASAAEENVKTADARVAKTEARLRVTAKEREDALDECERLRTALAESRRDHETSLQTTVEQQKVRVSTLELSIRDYELKIERLETSLRECETKILADETAMKTMEEELATSTADLHRANERSTNYETAESAVRGENERLKREVEKLAAASAEKDVSAERAREAFAALKTEQSESANRVKDLEAECDRLRGVVDRLNETVTLTNQTASQKDEAVDAAHADAERARAEQSRAVEALAEARAEIEAKESVLDAERRAREDVESTLEEVRAALRAKTTEARNVETRAARLEEETSTLKLKLEKESRRAMTTEEKNESAKEAFAARLAAAAEKQASFQGRMLEMKSTLETEKKKIEAAAREEFAALAEDVKALQHKLTESERARESASKSATDLEQRLEETLERLRETKDALDDAKSALVERDISSAETAHLSSELDAARERLKLVEMEHSQTALELRESKTRVASLEGKVAGLEGAADLAGAETEELRRRLHDAEQDAAATAEENELAASMAAKATMVANAQVAKLEKQIVALNEEIVTLRDKRAADVVAESETTRATLVELREKLSVSEARASELVVEVERLRADGAREQSTVRQLQQRLKAESDIRAAVETELEETRQKFTMAESRVYEVNTELLLVNKELEKEKLNAKRHVKAEASDLNDVKAARDAAVAKANDLSADLIKATAERDLLQESITNVEKRLEFERLAFASQVKEAVKEAVRSKENETRVVRKELAAIRQMSMTGDVSIDVLHKALDDKEKELVQAREAANELRSDVTRLNHQLEHTNELLSEARRDASMAQADEHDEMMRVREERDATKSALRDVEVKLADAIAAKEWMEKRSAAVEDELSASKEAAAAAMKMSEDARAQLARHKNLSPKSLISPKKSGPFGSPIAHMFPTSPVRWMNRSRKAETPKNNLFRKISMETPTVPTRTPGGSWRVRSDPESFHETMKMVKIVCWIIFFVFLFLFITPRLASDRTLRYTPLVAPAASKSCGMFYRLHEVALEFGHGLIGQTYRSMCVDHPPS